MKFSVLFLGVILFSISCFSKTVVVGSKVFTEAYILGEIVSQSLEKEKDVIAERRYGLGATGIIFDAITNHKIDLYVEYTGTLAEAILKSADIKGINQLRERLLEKGLIISNSLGFNNTYTIVVPRVFAEKHGLKKISDLKSIEDLVNPAISYEFLNRQDGYRSLMKKYNLKFKDEPATMDHSLLYQALATKKINVAEVYSTDAKIKQLDLVLLEDDLNFFPLYEPVIVARKEFVDNNPLLWKRLSSLEGTIDNYRMIELNAMADLERRSFAEIAYYYFNGVLPDKSMGLDNPMVGRLWSRTKEHLFLVFIAVFFSTLIGVPLGILATRKKWLGQIILSASGVLQTIPSLALLCFLIPIFGIGTKPAIIALFLYGLLPVVLNTFTGIESIEGKYKETALALGLSPVQVLLKIELPLASQSIWAGITTSTIISIGTATLAALIGAGGYGAAIVTGLALNDTTMILYGAVPAAILALVAQITLRYSSRFIVPKGLR